MVLQPGQADSSSSDSSSSSDQSSLHEEIELDDGSTTLRIGHLTLPGLSTGGLKRHLGLFTTVLLVVGRIIGTGIFSTPSAITKSVGSAGAALLLWTLGFFVSCAGLMVWIELGCMIPRSGGEKVYLEAAYQRPKLLATTIFAFQAVLLGFSGSFLRLILVRNRLVPADSSSQQMDVSSLRNIASSPRVVLLANGRSEASPSRSSASSPSCTRSFPNGGSEE